MDEDNRGGLLSRWWGLVTRRAPRGRPSLPQPDDRVAGRPIGESGLTDRRWFTGISPDNEEIGSDFADMATWLRTARSMLRTDPVLAGAWAYVSQRQLGGLDRAYWQPADGTKEAKRNADFLNENFGLGPFKGRGRMYKGLLAQWRSILTWQPFGACLLEEVDHVAPDAGGVERVWLSSYEPRSLMRLESWIPSDDGTYMVAAIMRRYDGSTYRLPICDDPEHPGRGSLYITSDVEGGDPEGRLGAMLRPAYGYWRLKRLALDQLGVGLERWGSELPVGRINYQAAKAADLSENRIREARAAMLSLLRDMKAREESYALESDIAEVRPFGARFEPDPLGGLIETLDRQMLTSFFMQGITLGVQAGGVGSYNAATVHHDGALQIMANMAELTAEAISEQTARRLIRLNYGPGSPVPRLILPGVRRDPMPEMAAHLAQAAGYGGITPTDDLEEALRVSAGLPTDTYPSRTWEERMGRTPPPPVAPPGPGRPPGPVAPEVPR